jgi:cytochrome o ubiquinol oxidase subunit II
MNGKTSVGWPGFLAARYLAICPALLLSGCNLDVLNPKGSVGLAEKSLILDSTFAMLVVVIPVIALTLLFAWRYRVTNKAAAYSPKWLAGSEPDHPISRDIDVEKHPRIGPV